MTETQNVYIEIMSEDFKETVNQLKSLGCRFGTKTIDLGIGSGYNSVGQYYSGKNTKKFWFFDTDFIKTKSFNSIMCMAERDEICLQDDPHGKYYGSEKLEQLKHHIKERDEKWKRRNTM